MPMARLRAVVEGAGFTSVQTYIQSGNVLLEGTGTRAAVEQRVEEGLERELGYPLVVVVRTHAELRSVVQRAPEGFGAHPGRFNSDAVFLKAPLTAAKAMRVVETKEGVDRAWAGTGVIYFERLTARRTASRMSRIMGTPEYQLMTIRNWATTTKLLALLDA